jgi:hypothetical protein
MYECFLINHPIDWSFPRSYFLAVSVIRRVWDAVDSFLLSDETFIFYPKRKNEHSLDRRWQTCDQTKQAPKIPKLRLINR